jgi:hypothetical protein
MAYNTTRSETGSDIMLKLKDLDDRRCIAQTSKHLPCGSQISKGELTLATSKLNELHNPTIEEASVLKAIIKLLICANHRRSHTEVQLDALIRKYKSELLESAKMHEAFDFTSYRAWHDSGARRSVREKLGDVIKGNEYQTGSVYGFTWDVVPGLIKIGYAKDTTNDRVKQWHKCHPGATRVFNITFDFPHRMEELIHTQMANKRQELECRLKACPLDYHNEWFKSSVEEAELIVRRWKSISEIRPLYDLENRKLTGYWESALQDFPIGLDMTAETLLDYANKHPMVIDSVLENHFAQMSLLDENHADIPNRLY